MIWTEGRLLGLLAALAMAIGTVTPGAEMVVDEAAGAVSIVPDDIEPQADAIDRYWTLERMERAQPAPFPVPPVPQSGLYVEPQESAVDLGPPGFAPAWSPGSREPPPFPDDTFELNFAPDAADISPMTFGAAPTDPVNGPYGPFQRWSMHGRYVQWPRSIHGKLFYSQGGSNYVCSATVIGLSTIATAGHCVAAGDGSTWSSTFLFCPSYNQEGQNSTLGCWPGIEASTSGAWFSRGDFDYDYGCIVTATTGTVKSDKIGNVTGMAGRAWNLPSSQPTLQFGYPAAVPFNGKVIQQVATTEWYELDIIPGGQVSKFVGSDLTAGSSGGGWFVSWRHPHTEFPDTDGKPLTDPYGAQNGPLLNGVISLRRSAFTQELASPQFLRTAAGGESEDIFALCLAHENN
jgi:hypothetical protein